MATVKISSASIDERGQARGGQAGNQNGKELRTQSWYLPDEAHGGAWRVLRAINPEVADLIGDAMLSAVANPDIGYDQDDRLSLFTACYAAQLKGGRFWPGDVDHRVECDCSALVRVCIEAAGVECGNFTTYNEVAKIQQTGAFVELDGDAYTKHSSKLCKGDVLVTAKPGHTVIVTYSPYKRESYLMPTIRKGSKCYEVATLQRLLKVVLSKSKLDIDGDFGQQTENALKEYQKLRGLEVDGVCGNVTWNQILRREKP